LTSLTNNGWMYLFAPFSTKAPHNVNDITGRN
jgi:hypothetical protein